MSEKYNRDGTVNENWVAEQIAAQEGLKESISIAQVKEVLRIALELFAELTPTEMIDLVGRHQ